MTKQTKIFVIGSLRVKGTWCKYVDPDETAQSQPSHQDLHCTPFFFFFFLHFDRNTFLQQSMSKSNSGRVQFNNIVTFLNLQ